MASPQRTLRATSLGPDHRTAAVHRLLTAVVEAVDGRRPLNQLSAYLSPPAAAEVGKVRVPGQGVRLDTMRLCRVSPDVTELAAVVSTRAGRVRALAARVEWSGNHCRCTEFHLLP